MHGRDREAWSTENVVKFLKEKTYRLSNEKPRYIIVVYYFYRLRKVLWSLSVDLLLSKQRIRAIIVSPFTFCKR